MTNESRHGIQGQIQDFSEGAPTPFPNLLFGQILLKTARKFDGEGGEGKGASQILLRGSATGSDVAGNGVLGHSHNSDFMRQFQRKANIERRKRKVTSAFARNHILLCSV